MSLPEADYDMTALAMQGQGNPVPQQSTLYARFYTKAKQMAAETVKQGRPIFKDMPYVEIRIPGNKTTIINRAVKKRDIMQFPRQWAAFQASEEQPLDGTPLAEWPHVTRAMVEEMRHFGIMTVEQLVAMPDAQAQQFMGINILRQKAKDFLELAKSTAPIEELRSENDALKAQLEEMQVAIAEMKAVQDQYEIVES